MTLPRAIAAVVLLIAVFLTGKHVANLNAKVAHYEAAAQAQRNALDSLRSREKLRLATDSARQDSLRALTLQNAQKAALIARWRDSTASLDSAYRLARSHALGDSSVSPIAREALSQADSLIAGLNSQIDDLTSLVDTQGLQVSLLERTTVELRESRDDLQRALDKTVLLWHQAEELSQCHINLGLFKVGCPSRGVVGIVGVVTGAVLKAVVL